MNSREFFRRIFKTGDASEEDVAKFMSKNYFLNYETFQEFEDDLVFVNGKSEEVARAVRILFEEKLRMYSK